MTETTGTAGSRTSDGAARVILERYRLERPIGRGGMGEVWGGYDLRLDRRVAVKLLRQPAPSAGAASAEPVEIARQRFLREVRTTAGIVHPGIPAVHDTGVDPATGELFLVMQLLSGPELADVIAEHTEPEDRLPVSWAAAVGAQVASVLAEVHRLSVVHRDIKPRNLMLTPGGIVKVLDFGVAALTGPGIPKLTQIGHTIGTPAYMSPEQVVASTVGPPSDLYALGCVIYELLTGGPPFRPDDPKLGEHHVWTPPPPVRRRRPDVPERIENLVLAMLRKDAEDRPGTDAVYDTLLPFTGDGSAVPGREELNPTRPFTRPMAAIPRRRRAAGEAETAAPLDLPPLSQEEADEVAARAAALADEGQFSQASDVLERAIARLAGDELGAADLRFRLANVLFLAGAYRRALTEFDAVGAILTEAYEPADRDVLDCRYYAATCRAALGENSEALRAFRAFLPEWVRAMGGDDERALDVRQKIGLLLASAGRHYEALATLTELRADVIRLRGAGSPEAGAVAAMLNRLTRASAPEDGPRGP